MAPGRSLWGTPSSSYILTGKRDRIRGKTIGTTLGVAAAIPVAMISPPAGVLAIEVVIALTQAKRCWLMYGLYTFSLILLLASPGPRRRRGRGTGLSDPRRHRACSSSASPSSTPSADGWQTATHNPNSHTHNPRPRTD